MVSRNAYLWGSVAWHPKKRLWRRLRLERLQRSLLFSQVGLLNFSHIVRSFVSASNWILQNDDLLWPLGGRTELVNPNNKQFRITGKEKEEIEAILYHTATHDACGYLSEYHKIGPGYNYLGTMLTVFPSCIPQSGRLAALMFWKKLINEPDTPFEY